MTACQLSWKLLFGRGYLLASNNEKSGNKIEPAELTDPNGQSPVLLVCEHASKFVPQRYNNLGMDAEAAKSHAAWDLGALDLARTMSELLDARLVAGTVSRLVYDCNRPPDSPAAVLSQSEMIEVPGNASLSITQRQERVDRIYEPFRNSLAGEIDRTADGKPVLVTIHSFTPVFMGMQRQVEIGILHDSDTRLADAMLGVAARCGSCQVMRNQPYGPQDGVTHTLKLHGIDNGILNVMIEVANNLIETVDKQRELAALLCGWLTDALAKIDDGSQVETVRCRA